MLGDGFRYYVCHFRISKSWRKLELCTPYLLQKYFKRYKKSPNPFKNIMFCKSDALGFWRFENCAYQQFWEFRKLDFWSFEILKIWNFEILEIWNLGILKLWNCGIRTFANLEKTGPKHMIIRLIILEILNMESISSWKHEMIFW